MFEREKANGMSQLDRVETARHRERVGKGHVLMKRVRVLGISIHQYIDSCTGAIHQVVSI